MDFGGFVVASMLSGFPASPEILVFLKDVVWGCISSISEVVVRIFWVFWECYKDVAVSILPRSIMDLLSFRIFNWSFTFGFLAL